MPTSATSESQPSGGLRCLPNNASESMVTGRFTELFIARMKMVDPGFSGVASVRPAIVVTRSVKTASSTRVGGGRRLHAQPTQAQTPTRPCAHHTRASQRVPGYMCLLFASSTLAGADPSHSVAMLCNVSFASEVLYTLHVRSQPRSFSPDAGSRTSWRKHRKGRRSSRRRRLATVGGYPAVRFTRAHARHAAYLLAVPRRAQF